ncbi:DNA polymerase III subunit gamma/tau [Geoalkalibacter subterraneus]|uniref:DNA polymerase III subunit gamma/tau n=1 Tax=Geoalkalibacter subterraneus TaxID=483547 RepID=A0A0B5FDW4_9BACT|nr:DNA polymerase III subunit gamma/tau [Geoalkalibacter subterraneus]AJF05483.1 DNA polymerase III subunits gamma and tau [Geoalkalibacter subterraneus]
MSYLVLARKWRPQTFSDLIGQEHVSRTLGNAIRTDRVHHAFLFTGARGVGKTSAARIFAKALNCEQGLSDTPCNQCPTCVEITNGHSVDVLEIDGASNTGVDDVRELRESIRYLPSRARYKIFIIDEVHMLSNSAFNALLKTLEEPPPHAKFVFATTEPHKIPATILSRCQRFDFRKIALPHVAERLRYIVDQEGIRVSDHALALIARRGEGSMRDALSALDQVIAFCGEEVRDEDILTLFGQVERRILLNAIEAILRRDPRRALDVVRRVDDQGQALRPFCGQLVESFRTLVLLKVADDACDLVDATPEELEEFRVLIEMVSLEDLQRILTLLMKVVGELPASSFPRLTLEMALVRLTALPPAREVGALIRKMEDFERRLGGGEALRSSTPSTSGGTPPLPDPPSDPVRRSAPSERESSAVPVPPPVEPSSAPSPSSPRQQSPPDRAGAKGRNWQGLVDKIRKVKPLLASFLEHGSLVSSELPHLEIAFPAGSFYLEQLKDAEKLAQLEKLATQYFEQAVKLKVSILDGNGAAPPPLVEERRARQESRRDQLRREALDHPKIRTVLEIFGGDVKEVKPLAPTQGEPSSE